MPAKTRNEFESEILIDLRPKAAAAAPDPLDVVLKNYLSQILAKLDGIEERLSRLEKP